MSEAKNVDDVLTKVINQQLTGTTEPPVPVEVKSEPEVKEEVAEVPQEPIVDETDKKQEATDSPIDEYGNPVEKSKMYSEEEVQRIVKDRLSRGRHIEQQPVQQQQPQQQQTTANEDETWDIQLKKYVRNEYKEIAREEQEKAWREKQVEMQAQFESKFTTGMNKYSDFNQVVSGKTITDAMLLATRSLDNPAAFVYGAAKLHPQELDRIARLDPTSQSFEIGRLHEKMMKDRKLASNAPRPLETPKGDMPNTKVSNQPSLEERIHQYGSSKRK